MKLDKDNKNSCFQGEGFVEILVDVECAFYNVFYLR
jgi:hypothetical protein